MEELLDKIIEMLKAAPLNGIHTFMFGDPITYPMFDLPAVSVAPGKEAVVTYSMGRDMNTLLVSVFIVRNAREGFNNTTREAPSDRNLIRDAGVVVKTLRANVTLDDVVAQCKGCAVQYVPGVRQKELLRIAQVNAEFELLKSR
jgi:hypothetical protein